MRLPAAVAGNGRPARRVAVEMQHVGSGEAVTVYWRPGCPYCALLRRGLGRAGITTTEVNIWDDPQAAATVRSLANGNETVPTVVVGATSLVNPSVRAVVDAVEALEPRLAASPGDDAPPRRWSRWLPRQPRPPRRNPTGDSGPS